ncbi:hypothetical protein [Clostridium perfringens]|uniref:hypothetical protein n=1 Tax=Clostridium perfringens TaxID=1502 RepID=UPI000B133D94|nr:hypothetical protein [Clostridium perfringens]MDU4051127.1 hypothetical protein [Clostridium perfringens]
MKDAKTIIKTFEEEIKTLYKEMDNCTKGSIAYDNIDYNISKYRTAIESLKRVI